ncbi:hypothetical protein EMPS_08686 [Entomortierella parvispora]|uniref:F-box domain-containing protein n=1 Tax=Entomortierella parvispora TaxID=205924 RepID=A0A9P3LZN9_9FUNG|nr:hypothetical protein EMPS_08686 [Entomortierella parvispora]
MQSPCIAANGPRSSPPALLLPELLNSIALSLDYCDLLRCVAVSRLWYSAFAPFLWSNCHDTARPWRRILKEADLRSSTTSLTSHPPDPRKNEATSLFRKLGPYVRHLNTSVHYTVHLFLDLHRSQGLAQLQTFRATCLGPRWFPSSRSGSKSNHTGTRCESLLTDVPSEVFYDPDPTLSHSNDMKNQMRAIWQLIHNNPSLRRIEFFLSSNPVPFRLGTNRNSNSNKNNTDSTTSLKDTSSLPSSPLAPGAQFLATTLKRLPCLQHFRLHLANGHETWTLPILANFGLGSLQSLDLSNYNQECLLPSVGEHRQLFVNPKVRILKLQNVEPAALAALVQVVFPALEHLTMASFRTLHNGPELPDLLSHDYGSSKALRGSRAERSNNLTLKSLTIGGRGCLRLALVPIQWVALEQLKAPMRQLWGLNMVLHRMPNVRQVINIADGRGHFECKPEPAALLVAFLAKQMKEMTQIQLRDGHCDHSVQHFEVQLTSLHRGSALFSLLGRMPSLISLCLGRIRPFMLEVITEHCPLLQELTLEIKGHCSRELVKVLTTCKRLRVLKGYGLAVRAVDMIHKPWVCEELEELECAIVGIPRLTAEQEQIITQGLVDGGYNEYSNHPSSKDTVDSNWTTKHQQKPNTSTAQKASARRLSILQSTLQQHHSSLELQRKVLAQLGRFTKLRVLSLGHSLEKPPRPFPKSLELTLKSGLDQLSGLKSLQV